MTGGVSDARGRSALLKTVHEVEIVDYHQERDMAELLDEIHPGEILVEEFMKPMGITARQLAADIDVSPSRISELVNGRRPIPQTPRCASGSTSAWTRGFGSTCRRNTTCVSRPAN